MAMTHRTEPGELLSTILGFFEANQPFAVATVLRAEGSTPMPAGAKAVIAADGTIHGTVGGGAVEAEAQRTALKAVRSGKPVVFDFDLHGPGPQEPAPICGGFMQVLVDPAAAASRAHFQRAAEVLARRERGLWLTTLRQQGDLQATVHFISEADVSGHVGLPDVKSLSDCLTKEEPKLVSSADEERMEVFVEPLIPRPVLLIVGGGHVGQAVAAQASLLGFEITVIEDRPEFADARLFPPGTHARCGNVADEVAAFAIGSDTFIVIVTRGHQQDAAALRACIHRPAAYLGMIGSRRKVPLLRRQFIEAGWATAEEFDRVYAPIGLDIGAVTVPEIAASIVAQMVAVRRKGASSRIPLA
jgi:xanthine dehydrogenase accessory factor